MGVYGLIAMELSLENCWDCPVPLARLLLEFSVLAVVLIAGTWLLRRRGPALRGCGALLVAGVSLLAVTLTSAVPRWGILRSRALFDGFASPTVWIILIALDISLVALGLVAWRWFGRGRARPGET
jgi:hypothetical protein